METNRDDFIIAIRSAFLKKGTKQRFSLIVLLFFSLTILTLSKYNFKGIAFLKSGLNEEEGAADVKTIDKLLPKINNKAEYLEILPKVIDLDIPGVTPQTKKAMLLKLAKQLK